MEPRQKGFLAVFLAALLWSTGGLFIKLVDLPPLAITAWRSSYACLVFLVLFRSKILKTNRRMWWVSAFYAATLLAFVTATKLTTATNAIFLQFTAPVYVLLLEPFLFKLKMQRADILLVVVAIASMSLFFIGDFDAGGAMGNFLALGSGVSLAGFMLGQRLNKAETHFAAIFWGNLIVVIASLGYCSNNSLPLWSDWPDFWRLTFLGVVQIGLAYALFTYGLQRVLAIEASLLGFTEPILNPVWVWIGYGEVPSQWAMLGGLIIICSLVVWTVWTQNNRRVKGGTVLIDNN